MNEFRKSLTILSYKDPKLGKIIKLINPKYKKVKNDEFASLIKIIIGQQLSGSAAQTIVKRVENCLKNKKISPENICSITPEKLRECGVSYAKIKYIKNISKVLLDNPKYFEILKNNNENDILEKLCEFKGVGIWTASIFAMGTLHYNNVFPYGDVSLNKAIREIYGEAIPIEKIISKWSPFKSFASRVLWQWVDAGMPNLDKK